MALFDRSKPDQYALFEKKILAPYLEDTVIKSIFGKFTSSDSSGIIWELEKGNDIKVGETRTIGMVPYSDANEVYDDDTLAGKGDPIKPTSDTVKMGEVRFAVAGDGKLLGEIQVKIDLDSQLKQALHTKGELLRKRQIINQFGFCFMNGTRGDNHHRTYSYYKKGNATTSDFQNVIIPAMKACPIDQNHANSISSDRIVIGNDAMGALQNTVLLSIADARIGNADPTAADAGTLTVAHIEKLVAVANSGGRNVCSEQIIVPYKVSSRWEYENNNLILFIGPSSLMKLRQDPKWSNQISRSLIEHKGQPSMFYNTAYAGTVYGVDIIVVPEFDNFIMTNGDGSKIAYSALCGQGAIVSARGMDPVFTTENNDHTKKHELGVTMIQGMKPLKFIAKDNTRKNLNIQVERGIVHSFTRLS
jgi:hypothetical protein